MAEQKIYTSQISGGANINPNSSPYQNFTPPASAFEGGGKAIADGLLSLGKPLINLYDQTQEAQAKAWTANKLKEVQLSYQDKFAANEIQTKDGFDKTWQSTVKEIDDTVPNGRAQGMIKNHLNSLQLGYRQDAINIQNRNARNVIAGQPREFIDKNPMEEVDARTTNDRVYELADEVNNFSNSMLKTGTFTPEGATAINMQSVGFLRNTLSARAENPITARSMLEIVSEDGRLPKLTWEESQPLIAKAKLTDFSDKMQNAMPATMVAEVEKLKPSSNSKMPMDMQENLYASAQAKMNANLKAIEKDATAYLNGMPDVQFSRNAFESDFKTFKQAELQNKSPMSEVNEDMNKLQLNLDKSRDLYFNTLAKKQNELGIPNYDQRFLSEQGRVNLLEKFNKATSSGSQDEIARTVSEVKQTYGNHYNSVIASLGDLEPKVSILSSLNGQELKSFSNYMFSTREKGSMDKIASSISTTDQNTIEDAIDTKFRDYDKAILSSSNANGANYSTAMKQEIKNYAKFLVASGQSDVSSAAQKALDSTTKQSYLVDEVSSGSIPTLIPKAFEQDRELIKASLSQEFSDLTNGDLYKDKSHPLMMPNFGEYGGNVNLNNRPRVANPKGGTSTVLSMSFNEDGKEVLIPQVVNGKILSQDEAIKHYRKSGEFLGKFNSVEEANIAGERIHLQQEASLNKNDLFQITEDLDKNGYWSLMPNEKGWLLMSKDRMGVPYIVRDYQGKNIERTFEDFKSQQSIKMKKQDLEVKKKANDSLQKAKNALDNSQFMMP